jgi:hypothetical protein
MISDNVPGPSSEAIRTARPLFKGDDDREKLVEPSPGRAFDCDLHAAPREPRLATSCRLELLALVVELAVLRLVLWVALVVGGPIVDLGISTWNAAAATLAAVLLAFYSDASHCSSAPRPGIVPARSA